MILLTQTLTGRVQPDYHPDTLIILDEAFESPETAALHYEEGCEGGLLARATSPSDFLPMSGYGKQPRQFYGFDTNRSLSDSYGQASSFALQPTSSVETAAFQNAPLLTALSYDVQSRMPFDDQAGPYLNVGSAPTPQVTSYRPSMGCKGGMMEVYVSSLYELATSNLPTFFLMFSSHRCPATCAKIDQHGGVCEYVVSATIPPFAATGSHSMQVQVSLLIESSEGELQSRSEVGRFTYMEEMVPEASNSAEAARKRKLSLESTELMRSPAKRASNQQLRPKEDLVSYGYVASDEVPLSPYIQPSPQYNIIQPYNRTWGQYQSQSAQRAAQQYAYATSSTASPPTTKAPSPQVSTWSPYSTMSSYVTPSPSLTTAAASTKPALPGLASPLAANPPLIRTSTLQQSPSPSTTPAGTQPASHAFNPYLHYPHKAVLEMAGDLDSMTGGWTVDEWAASRRIVMFKRAQNGCTINTTFSAVSADERPPLSICVSCIYWEEKNECFITSVDTIYLLESLIGARFTVEEKNRIRRNLEGFKPLTVSKAKAGSEEFFRLIMGFPNPKPRNIEKDVKVFSWKILVHALSKIIGKYSASPSSTLPPASSTGHGTEASSAPSHGSEPSNLLSPASTSRSISGTSASTAYAPRASSTKPSPSKASMMTVSNGGPPDLRFSTPSYPLRHDAAPPWQGAQQHMPRVPYAHPHRGGAYGNARSSYDLSSYLDTSAATAAAGPGPRRSLEYGSSGHNSMEASGRSMAVADGVEGGRRRNQHPSQQMPSA